MLLKEENIFIILECSLRANIFAGMETREINSMAGFAEFNIYSSNSVHKDVSLVSKAYR